MARLPGHPLGSWCVADALSYAAMLFRIKTKSQDGQAIKAKQLSQVWALQIATGLGITRPGDVPGQGDV